jgi:hypothetical protein
VIPAYRIWKRAGGDLSYVVRMEQCLLLADCVAKSQIDSRWFFREKTKQAAIVNGYGVKFVSEVACEFIAVR